MFSSALKSFSSNISSNYTISPQPSSAAGPWRIFEAKRKGSGKAASVFVFDKKSLEPTSGGLGGRSGSSSIKAAQHEVLERLKKEASSLARLRHPSILELAEPVEETRNGGLMFATEPVTASLSGLLADKDDQERSGGSRNNSSRYVVEESDGTKKSKPLDLDELEIQKGLLQVAKGLEFMHESAGLVHANINPDSVVINAKGDWKITGLAFAGPASDSNKPSSIAPIALSEVLNHDPRLPASVQLDLNYTSPDFVLDNNLTSSADIFSLGILIVALYNKPHQSPIDCHGSLSSYKRVFSSSSSVPSRSNSFLCAGSLPPNLASDMLPRLITRRPASRMTAKEFQQAAYFDNILVSTLRFMEAFPAKTSNEKTQFMRGLPRIMPQFPSSVLERKLLPALLEEMKDRDLLSPLLQNIFAIIKALPAGKEPFTNLVIPRLRQMFLDIPASKTGTAPKDTSKEAGLMIVLENMQIIAECTSGKEFAGDILPIIAVGLASPTHAVVDASLSTLAHVTPKLDYTTIKNDLFPVIAGVFAHTNSLGIKIQGLEAFHTLCGGTEDNSDTLGDGLDGNISRRDESKLTSSAVLDKFTVQEKIVPLLKGIKTKEPGVIMAALKVFRQVGKIADTDFLAMDVLPILWAFSLGPLLDLSQFQAYMTLIKSLSSRIEAEHTQKLRELTSSNVASTVRAGTAQARHAAGAVLSTNGEEVDFESLVTGRGATNGNTDMMGDWDAPAARPTASRTVSSQQAQSRSTMPWATGSSSQTTNGQSQSQTLSSMSSLRPMSTSTRSVTPDQSLNAFSALTPASPFSQPLQPSRLGSTNLSSTLPVHSPPQNTTTPSIDWSRAIKPSSNAWASSQSSRAPPSASAFSIAPPPRSPINAPSATQPTNLNAAFRPPVQTSTPSAAGQTGQRQGLDKYESLL